MKILFIHQNCPGQYKYLVRSLAADPANQVLFITKPKRPDIPGVRKIEYQPHRKPSRDTHRYIAGLEDAVLHGQAVAKVAMTLRSQGFMPDVICAHAGWGEALYVKDVWPNSALLGFFEFYYNVIGSDLDFDPAKKVTIDDACRIRTRNANHLLTLEAADWGISPTRWQWQQFPAKYRDKISVIHDGIDTLTAVPDPGAVLTVTEDIHFKAGDEVVTYISRNLEPYRGFPSFMRAAEIILKRRPECHIVVVGGDGVSYGEKPKDGKTYRERMLEEVELDLSRIHFLGKVPYSQFLKVLQISSAHVYLTVPFVLSWSMLEAMSAGCVVIGSSTPPVTEVIEDGVNGLLADFFSPDVIAGRVDEVLDHPDRMRAVRRRARDTIVEKYSLDACLPSHTRLLETLINKQTPQRVQMPRVQNVVAFSRGNGKAGPARKRKKRK